MGMFDSVYFTTGNTVCDAVPEEYRQDEWQTKDLYNSLYALVIENNLTYYRDRGGALHHLPLNGSFEIHNWDSEKATGLSLQVDAAHGVVTKVGPVTSSIHGVMPHVPAMDADAAEDCKGWENTMNWLTELEAKKTPWQKFTRNFSSARREWSEALRHLVSGFKRLFGHYGF